MNGELFSQALGEIDDKYIAEAASCRLGRGCRPCRIKWAVCAACLALVAAAGILTAAPRGTQIALSDASSQVTAQYIGAAPAMSARGDLVDLTEEELFTHFNTAIFRGTVSQVRNIRLDFNGFEAYRAVAEIRVDAVYRGPCQAGDTVSVLLPCPVTDGVWTEDCDIVSAMAAGTTGIFMPMVYDDSSTWEQNGAVLALKDLADYGFADGSRYAFLMTEDGLVFDRTAYPSLAGAAVLDQVEDFILSMLDALPAPGGVTVPDAGTPEAAPSVQTQSGRTDLP